MSACEPSLRTRAIAFGVFVLRHGGAALTGIALVLASACGRSATEKLEDALVGRGRVVVLGGDDLVKHAPQGVELVPVAKFAEVDRALAGTDDRALANAMQAAKVAGVLVDARRGAIPPSYKLGARMASYASFEALQGVFLSPRAAFYVLDPVRAWSQELRTGIAVVARRLVGGEQPPHMRSFPAVMRRMEPAEVMVLLRLDGRARLWRSARGTSFARALLTAAEVARQRWIERSQAMGGPLNEILPKMQVEVSLLQDDGEIGSTAESFVNRVVLPVHGVAFEHKGAWRYLLPEATHTKELKTPYRAYERLFADDGLPDDSLDSQELRPYRMIVKVIGISPAQRPAKRREPKDGLSDVKSPDEVLAP